MIATDYTDPSVGSKLLRGVFLFIDVIAYVFLASMYEIFFNVAGAELFQSATIKHFYSRMQLIIGVFMVFKLAVSIMQGIMNPDKFTDSKSGFGSVVTRIIISLAMLVAIVPINIPNAEPYSFNARLNNDGLLFGVLYSLQDRVLSNNTLGRLVLGTTDNLEPTSEEEAAGITAADKQNERLSSHANLFTTTILRGFVRVNLVEGATDDTVANNRMCPDSESSELIRGIYANQEATPEQILSLVEYTCSTGSFFDYVVDALLPRVTYFLDIAGIRDKNAGFYVFEYSAILSTIVAIAFGIILLLFTIDIAVRAIKLSILRLIAPIPIISYIDPKSAEKGSFAAWVKMLMSTYLDIFLRLAIIYFVIFLIQDMMVNGLIVNTGSGFVGVLSWIFICLGLFAFAKQAPKFIKDALGIQGLGMSNIGLSGALAAVGAIRQGGSLMDTFDAMSDVKRAQDDAYNQGKPMPGLATSYNAGRDTVAKMLTGDPNMTGRKMSRGARHLKAMDIDSEKAAAKKNEMYAAQDEMENARDLYDRYSKNNITKEEEQQLAAKYGHKNGYGQYVMSDKERENAGRELYNDVREKTKREGKVKSEYEDITSMQKQYGQSRTYEAQYEGPVNEDGRYKSKRNIINRSIAGLGRTANTSKHQAQRTQDVNDSATTVTNANSQGIDITPAGGTGGRI